MLKPVLNRKSVLACLADCPADNHARQLAQFLYGTLSTIAPDSLRLDNKFNFSGSLLEIKKTDTHSAGLKITDFHSAVFNFSHSYESTIIESRRN